LGYNTNAIVSVPINDEANGKNIVQQMRMRLSSQPSIESVTGSSINLGMGKDGSISKWSSSFRLQREIRVHNMAHGRC
jgi:putative ABC transport system permease protein